MAHRSARDTGIGFRNLFDFGGRDDGGLAALRDGGPGGWSSGRGGGRFFKTRGSAPTDITLSNDDVDENSPGGTLIGTLGAVDSDRRERFTFKLLDDAGGLFAISGRNKLVVADGAQLDYESAPTHQVLVQVTDRQGNTYQEWITININDLPEGAPNTAPTDISLSGTAVDENSPGGTVVGTLSNDDPDAGDSWTYTITNDPDGVFAIVGDQLVVREGAVLDYESKTSHSVSIRVTDAAGASYTESFTISVNDLPEGPSNTAPTDISLSGTAVDENSPGGTVVGTLSNDDPDAGDSWTYTITNDPDGVFAIVGDQLVVREGAVLDYESKTSHSVTIRVTDAAGASYTEAFTITVNDLPEQLDSAPNDLTLSGTTVAEGAENGTVIGALSASDPDAGETFRYVLLDGADGRFTLEGNQLVLANTSAIDYESAASWDVTVRVIDSTGLSYDETFSIGVINQTGIDEQPNYVQALVRDTAGAGAYTWPDADPSDQQVTITFAILDDFPSYYDPTSLPYTDYAKGGAVDFTPLTSAQITAIYQIIAELEELTGIDFVEVANGEQANITFGSYHMDARVGAYAYYPSSSGAEGTFAGDVWLNSRYDRYPSTSETRGADWARSTIAHELGHALGLKHPGNYDAGSNGPPPPYLDPEVDNGQYTVMSYNDYPYSSKDPVDYQLYDIAALQYLYGANDTHALGDTFYFVDPGSSLIDTIWDAGGHDTLSAAGSSVGVTIDLNQGAFSSIGLTNNIAIAWGTEIEAAEGGSGNDTLIGNYLDNTFEGGAGADTFVFLDDWGSDIILDFENGLDRIDLSTTGYIFEDLSITGDGADTLISVGTGDILLSGLDASLVDASDFVFV